MGAASVSDVPLVSPSCRSIPLITTQATSNRVGYVPIAFRVSASSAVNPAIFLTTKAVTTGKAETTASHDCEADLSRMWLPIQYSQTIRRIQRNRREDRLILHFLHRCGP